MAQQRTAADPFSDRAAPPDLADSDAASEASSETRRSRQQWRSEWDRQWRDSRNKSEPSLGGGDKAGAQARALLVDLDDEGAVESGASHPNGIGEAVGSSSNMTTTTSGSVPAFVEGYLNISATRHTRTRTFALPPTVMSGLTYSALEDLLELQTPWKQSQWARTARRRRRGQRDPRETASTWAHLWNGANAHPDLVLWVEHPLRSGKWKRIDRWGDENASLATPANSVRRTREVEVSLADSLMQDFWRERLRSGGYTLLAVRVVGSGPPGTPIPARSSTSLSSGLLRRDREPEAPPATSLERVGKGLSRMSVGLASLFGALDAVDPQLRQSDTDDFNYVTLDEASDEERQSRRTGWRLFGIKRKRRSPRFEPILRSEDDGNVTDSTAYAGFTDDEDAAASAPALGTATGTAVQVLKRILPKSWFRATGLRAPRRRVPTGRLVDLAGSESTMDSDAQERGEEDARLLQGNEVSAGAAAASRAGVPPSWPASSSAADRKLRKAALKRDRARRAEEGPIVGRSIWKALLGRRLGSAADAAERAERQAIQRREWISPAAPARRTLRERLDLDPQGLRASRPLPPLMSREAEESDAADSDDDGRRITIATSAALSSYEVFLDRPHPKVPPLPGLSPLPERDSRSGRSHKSLNTQKSKTASKSSRAASQQSGTLRVRNGSYDDDDPFRYIPTGSFGPSTLEGVARKDLPPPPSADAGGSNSSLDIAAPAPHGESSLASPKHSTPLSSEKRVPPSPDSGFISSGGPSSPSLPSKLLPGRAKPTAWRFGKTKRTGEGGYASADDVRRTSLDSASEAGIGGSVPKQKKKKPARRRRGSASGPSSSLGDAHFVGAQVVRRPEDALSAMRWKGGEREEEISHGRRASEELRPDFGRVGTDGDR